MSQHTTARDAVLRCQQWIRSDPWTYPDGDGALNHYYGVEARDAADALELAVARHAIAAEDAAAGRLSRYPRFDEPGGRELHPGEDDDPREASPRLIFAKDATGRRCRVPRPLRRPTGGSADASGCLRRRGRLAG